MAKEIYRLRVTVEQQDRRLFGAGAAALGITPAKLVENLIADWCATNRDVLASLAKASSSAEPELPGAEGPAAAPAKARRGGKGSRKAR